ncbi:MAG: hypothetical protein SWJ54_13375 [Cyanobacteriota bacterium]|nr:hypothetical protein [Cyanobacteriota bacterium]
MKASQNLVASSHHKITQNPPDFSLTFECLQIIGFKIHTETKSHKNSIDCHPDYELTQLNSDSYTEKIGEIIATIQTQLFSDKTSEKKPQPHRINEAIIILNIEEMDSFSIHKDFAQWVAENSYLAANIISVIVRFGEVGDAGLESAAIDTIINILSSSMKMIATYCRGELELKQSELIETIEIIVAGLKIGCLKDITIDIIHKLMDGSAFAALGFTVGIEVIPTFIKVLKDEVNLDQALQEVEPRMFTSAVITTIVILFPTLGTRLLSATVIKAIWEEISPEWRSYVIKMETQINSAICSTADTTASVVS